MPDRLAEGDGEERGMSEVRCATCGRGMLRDDGWPCLCEENAILRRERDEARAAARFAYWNVPQLVMDLTTGKFWHKELYPWLQPTAPVDEPAEGGRER